MIPIIQLAAFLGKTLVRIDSTTTSFTFHFTDGTNFTIEAKT